MLLYEKILKVLIGSFNWNPFFLNQLKGKNWGGGGGGGGLKKNIAFPWIGALASSTSALYLFAYIKIDKDKKYMYIYMKICKQGVNK